MAKSIIRCKSHLQFIRELECVLCGNPGVEAAHLRWKTDGGMGMKPSDSWVLPLCSHHHRIQHSIGEPRFWEGWDPHTLCEELWAVSGDLMEGEAIIERSRHARREQVIAGVKYPEYSEGGEVFSF